MILKIQLISFIFSFFYGICFYLLLELNYKFIFTSKLAYRIIVSILFVTSMSLVYFIGLLKINNGILHFYFFLMILLGYTFANFVRKKVFVKRK